MFSCQTELTSPRRQEERYLKQPVFSFSMQHLGKSDVLFRYEKLFSGNLPKCNLHCFVDTSANNFAMKAKRKTLNAGDVMSAMEEMEFERFLQPLREALEGKHYMKPKTSGAEMFELLKASGIFNVCNWFMC